MRIFLSRCSQILVENRDFFILHLYLGLEEPSEFRYQVWLRDDGAATRLRKMFTETSSPSDRAYARVGQADGQTDWP